MSAPTLRLLDLTVDTIPMDMVGYYQAFLKPLGVIPREYTTYKRAGREGWAPAPTNDIQKAIWEKMNQVPDKPMTIEFGLRNDK